MSKTPKQRTAIPKDTRRRLLIEAGYCCSMPGCTQATALDFHHIDGDCTNHEFDNLLVLCSNHHRLATSGQIDRKACRLIKKNLGSPDSLTSSIDIAAKEFRKVLRQELKTARGKRPAKVRRRRERSIFNRKYLFRTLKTLGSPRDIYLSIRLLGELKYRGSADAIIGAIEELRKNTPKRKKEKFWSQFYFPALDSLSALGTRKAMQWMAREFLEGERDLFATLALFLKIAENDNAARKFVAFRRLSRATIRKGKKQTREDTYKICGRQFSVRMSGKEIQLVLPRPN